MEHMTPRTRPAEPGQPDNTTSATDRNCKVTAVPVVGNTPGQDPAASPAPPAEGRTPAQPPATSTQSNDTGRMPKGWRQRRNTGTPRWLVEILDFYDVQLSMSNTHRKRLMMLVALTVCTILVLATVLGAVVLVVRFAPQPMLYLFGGATLVAAIASIIRACLSRPR